MSRRIASLKESPCYQCGCTEECQYKITKNRELGDIRDVVFGNAEFDFHNCGIWIAVNAPRMVDES